MQSSRESVGNGHTSEYLTDMADNKIHPKTANGSPPRTGDDGDVDEEAERKQKQRREQEPLFYCKLVSKYPLPCFLTTLGGHILMVVISTILLISGFDLLPIDFENLPLEINSLPWRPRDLAFRQKDEYTGRYERVTGGSAYRMKDHFRSNVDLYYDGDGSNVFTKVVLEKINEYENQLSSVAEYNNTFCKLNTIGTACEKPISVIRFFDGTYSYVNPVFNDPNFDNVQGVIYEAFTNNATKGIFQFFLGKGYSITPTSVYNGITRSKMLFGYPLQAYSVTEDYEDAAKKFSADQFKPILEDIRDNSPYFDFVYRSDMLWFDEVFKQAMKDVMCAIGSICFIFVLILIHTRSLWITAFAVFSILTCFLCTNLIYVVVLDFRYIGFFHVLTIFIVLGIGADDIFVFYDVWRNTAYELYPSLAHRLSDAYRRSVKSMLFTSITTSVAFFASAISPLLATRSFGVFSGLVILVNYLSVILYFPTVVIMFHTKFEDHRWPCFKICTKDKTKETEQTGVVKPNLDDDPCVYIVDKYEVKDSSNNAHNSNTEKQRPLSNGHSSGIKQAKESNGKLPSGFVNGGFQYDNDCHSTSKHEMQINTPKTYLKPKDRKKKSAVVNFFRNKYSAVVTHKIVRWVILAFTAGVLGFFISQAVTIEPDNEGLNVLKDSHVFTIAAKHATSSFVQSNADRNLEIYIVWGFFQNDMSDCHFSTPKCKGEQRWDSNFNPSTPEAQLAVLNFCNKMKSFPKSVGDDYRLKSDFVTGDYKIDCFINNLGDFLDDETAATGTNWSLPYNYNKTMDFMDANPTYYNSSGFTTDYQDYLQIPISHWLSNKQTYASTDDYVTFDPLIGEELGTYSRAIKTDSTKMYGNNIKYVAIKVTTTMVVASLGYSDGIPIKDKWEAFVNQEMAEMPEGMKNGFQVTWQIWHWLHVQQMLAENAVYGIVIGVCLAFPILTLATMNFITGALATFSMCCSTVCVIGVIPLGGWKLGVLESLNMCMVVGLTVDYVVHLAEGYTLSLHKLRLSRVQDMLEEMAVSIFFGSCTTLGASLFMFIAQLSFFFQFGIFMFSTILFSLFFSMGMFVTLMGLVGPQHDTGNIIVLFRKIRSKCRPASSRSGNR